jgi:hypothetical protein
MKRFCLLGSVGESSTLCAEVTFGVLPGVEVAVGIFVSHSCFVRTGTPPLVGLSSWIVDTVKGIQGEPGSRTISHSSGQERRPIDGR